MKVMVIVKATKDSEAGVMPSEQLMAEMGKYNEELAKAGIMLAGEGLHPSSKGARVRFSGKNRTVIDGPFTETKELIAGFWMWRVKSMQEAIEWLKRCPNPHEDECEVEIRPVFEAEDFGEAFTPELREQEASIRAQTLGLGAVRFDEAPARVIVGYQQRYTPDTRASIPSQWERFAPHIGRIPGQLGSVSYGVSWNVDEACRFDYLTGVEVGAANGLPAGFSAVDLRPGRYAVFTHNGHVSTIDRMMDAIWTKWVPDAEVKVAAGPSFERYTDAFDPRTLTGAVEIWLPIES